MGCNGVYSSAGRIAWAPRFALTFDLADGAPLGIKIGYSTVDVEGARRNLEREVAGDCLDSVRAAARAAWNRYLDRADIDGTDAQKVNFYTALYHAFVQPNNIADVDGRYRGADGKVAVSKNGEYYSTLSLWDTYRAANPLYTLIAPEKIDAMVSTMVEHHKSAGFLPIWTLMGQDNQCMIGSHAVPVIVDAYLKGFRGFDVDAAYEAVRATLRERHKDRAKENWDLLDTYGYYPNDIVQSESVARLLECAYDDWCASVFAKKLGRDEDAAFFAKRAGNWRNVLDPETGFMRGRDAKGAWQTPFSPFALGHDATRRNDFTEGNAWQWTWHVMQDPDGLIAALGGRDKALAKLLALFEQPERTADSGFVLDANWAVRARQRAEPPRRLLLPVPRTRRPYGGARARGLRQVLPGEAGGTVRQRRLRADERVVRVQRDGVLSVQPLRRRVRPRRAADSVRQDFVRGRACFCGARSRAFGEEQVREVRDAQRQARRRLQAPPRRHRRRRRTRV